MVSECSIQILRVQRGLPLTAKCENCDGDPKNLSEDCSAPLRSQGFSVPSGPFVRINMEESYPAVNTGSGTGSEGTPVQIAQADIFNKLKSTKVTLFNSKTFEPIVSSVEELLRGI